MSETYPLTQLQNEIDALTVPSHLRPLLRKGQAFAQRYLQANPKNSSTIEDLTAAIETFAEARGKLAADDVGRSQLASVLGLLLSVRYMYHQVAEDRDKATHLLKEGIAASDLPVHLRAINQILLGQIHLREVAKFFQKPDALFNLLNDKIPPEVAADGDRAAALFRDAISSNPTDEQSVAIAEALLAVAESFRSTEIRLDRMMDAMTKLQGVHASIAPSLDDDDGKWLSEFAEINRRLETHDLSSSRLRESTAARPHVSDYLSLGPPSDISIISIAAELIQAELAQKVSVYLDTEDQEAIAAVLEALHSMYSIEGIELELDGTPRISSWWGKYKARAKEVAGKDGVVQRVAKIEHAIEVVGLRQPMAIENTKQAEAVSALITAIENVDNAVMMVGSVVMIKYTNEHGQQHLFTKTLSVAEIRAFEENQHLLSNPRAALDRLHLLAEASDEQVSPVD